MAMYRLEAKIVGRNISKAKGRGKTQSVVAASAYRSARKMRSIVAASAYRSGSKIRDEHNGVTHNYQARTQGVVETALVYPENAPAWARDPSQLWNKVEAGEKRKDAQLAREFILAVPRELLPKEQFQLAVDWVKKDLVSLGMVAEVSLHNPGSGTNPHVHVLCTLRKLEDDQFSAKKSREWNENSLLCHWRESWCKAENAALEKAGRTERVDHRSLKAQGIDRIPEPKMGKAATAMKRRGEDSERFKLWRRIKLLNETRPWARAIERLGEIHQQGLGRNWWERSLIFMAETPKVVRDSLRDTWETFLTARVPGRHGPGHEMDNGPEREGPELSR
jgi:hypothetical protein